MNETGTADPVAARRAQIIDLLRATNRPDIDKLISYLGASGFFSSPGSAKYHGCYRGGLAKHSLSVYELLRHHTVRLNLEVPEDSIVIAALLHDVCKIGAYLGESKPYRWNHDQPKGHAALSISRIKPLIELTMLEEKMILYHMGIYGLVEFQDPGKAHKGEYTLRNKGMANAWYHHPVVKVLYFCDELATLREKTVEA